MYHLSDVLEFAWSEGFLYKQRQGIFDSEQYSKLKSEIESFVFEDSESIDKRLVSLVWFTPLFVVWQKERLLENGITNSVIEEVENFFFEQSCRLLGTP